MNRILIAVNVVLAVTAIVLMWMTFRWDVSVDELLVNEKSYYEAVNQESREELDWTLWRIRQKIELSQRDTTIMTIHAANRIDSLLTTTQSSLDRTVIYRGNMDSVKSQIAAVAQSVAALQDVFGFTLPREISLLNAHTLPWELAGTNIEQLRNYLIDVCDRAMDSVETYADVSSTGYKPWLPPPSSEWVIGMLPVNVPVAMRVGKKERIQVRISRKLANDLLVDLKNPVKAASDSVVVGDVISLTLAGEFNISPLDEEGQGVTDFDYTLWEFEITPVRSGEHDLVLKADLEYVDPTLGRTKKSFTVYDERIQVK